MQYFNVKRVRSENKVKSWLYLSLTRFGWLCKGNSLKRYSLVMQEEGGREIRPWTNQYIFRNTVSLQNLFRTTQILFGTPHLRSKPSTIQ